MILSLFFKEWLKIKWTVFGIMFLFLITLGYIYIDTSYNFRNLEANNMWYNVITFGYLFYGDLFRFLPLAVGVVVALSQYLPEISSKRLRLTLHLPMQENFIILWMLFTGTCILIAIYLFSYLILTLISIAFFPFEILNSLFLTSMPWFLAGLVAYWAVAMIVIEPKWKTRIALIVVSLGFINFLFYSNTYNVYKNSVSFFFLFALIFALQIILSTHRFRKGNF